VFRPASQAYGVVFPEYVRGKVDNLRHNIDLPGEIINAALQGRGENTGHNFFRFMVNTTLGVLGIFDPATSFGLERRSTDFGETLFVWGVPEGAYVETPLFGPYTERSLAGDVVDLFLNPLTFVGLDTPEAFVPATTYVLEAANYRYTFRSTVDAILYESADSYAQTRISYLQNRRFTLERNRQAFGRGGGGSSPSVVDPYADAGGGVLDPYSDTAAAPAQPAASTTIDPYEELYAN